MHKVVKGLSVLVVVAGAAVGAYAWFSSRDKGDGGLKQVDIQRG